MKLISILMVLTLSFGAHAEMYKWVDAEGNITYSDRPQPDSAGDKEEVTEITLPPLNTSEALDTSVLRETTKNTQPDKKANSSIKITKPQNDEAIRQNEGNMAISVAVKPQAGDHTVAIYVDGNEVSRGSATSVALQNVDRGTHVITADLISPEGKVIKSASPVTFHLLRYSIRNKATPR
jgi:hypothetical protein